MHKPWIFALLLSAVSPHIWAQGSTLADQVAKCRAVTDAAQRLGCYDAIGAATPSPTPQADAAPASRTATPPSRSETSETSGFGLKGSSGDSIQSNVNGVFVGWEPRQRFELANGQIWQVIDGSSGFYKPMQNPSAKITKGFFSGFFLEIDGVNQRISVKRIR